MLDRYAEIRLEEAAQPLRWWWLSFVDTDAPADGRGDRWLGGCYVEARGVVSAAKRAWDLGINPGGEVAAIPVPEDRSPPVDQRNRLLRKDELGGFVTVEDLLDG
jgi:hypothetical protein